MQVKKLAILLAAASLATAMLTGCPWDKDDAASSDLPGGSSGSTSQGGGSGNTGNTGGTGGESTVTNYTVTVTIGVNGKVTYEGNTYSDIANQPVQVPADTTLTFTVTPAEKYTATVTVNGTALTPTDGKYSHTVDADCAIEVKFEDLGYTVDADGTYLVHSAEGLRTAMEENKTIALTENITLEYWSAPDSFYGTLDGKGYTITFGGPVYFGGLVGTNTGTIQNLVVTGTIGDESNGVGGVAGTNDGTIQGCVVKCSIFADMALCVGGIAGWNGSSGRITACCVVGGEIKGSDVGPGSLATGAIAGGNENAITACYWDCTVTGDKGVGNESADATKEATKVDGSTICWATAVDEMNKHMNTGYKYDLVDGKPALVPAGDANGTAGVLNRLHQVMERI